MNRAFEKLANAIVVQACKDYRDELNWLSAHQPVTEEDEEDEKYIGHLSEKDSIERFFVSDWFCALTDLDGQYIMQRIRKECAS